MKYGNPNRLDIPTYASWKTSPMALYKTFPQSVYRVLEVFGDGDDKLFVYCNHQGEQTGGPYMGIPPQGQKITVHWVSILTFTADKIIHLYSISDVLTMLHDFGVIAKDTPQV